MGFLKRLFTAPPQRPAELPRRQTGPITDWSEQALEGVSHSGWLFDTPTIKFVNVVGEGSYQGTLERVAGGRTIDGGRERDHKAILIPHPDNPYDPNAVRVIIGMFGTVGYLARDDAVAYRPVVDRLAAAGKVAMCLASLSGGWDRGEGDRGWFGVRLFLATPAELLAELESNPDALRPTWEGG